MNGKYLTLIGTALTLALTSNVALAQSSKLQTAESGGQPGSPSTASAGEVKLSPKVDKKKFCTDYPLNSRCQGEAASTPKLPGSSSETQNKPADNTVPGSTAIPGKAPADTGTTGNPSGTGDVTPPPAGNPSPPSNGTQQQVVPSGTGDPQTSPGGTTGAPDSGAPGGSNVPNTAPTDPSGTGSTPGSVAPLPPSSTTLPGGSTEQTAPGAGSNSSPSPSPGSGSGMQKLPSSGGSK